MQLKKLKCCKFPCLKICDKIVIRNTGRGAKATIVDLMLTVKIAERILCIVVLFNRTIVERLILSCLNLKPTEPAIKKVAPCH